jgi:hypothetical protein
MASNYDKIRETQKLESLPSEDSGIEPLVGPSIVLLE